MVKTFVILPILLIFTFSVLGQEGTIRGKITDAETGEELIGVTIYIKELKAGTITNAYGFYSLTLPEGDFTVVFSYMGYNSYEEMVSIGKSSSTSKSPSADGVKDLVSTSKTVPLKT